MCDRHTPYITRVMNSGGSSSSRSSKQEFLGGRHREKQGPRLTGEWPETVTSIESHGVIVLGVHQERKDFRRCLQSPACGIGQHRRSKAASPKLEVHSQASDAYCRQGRIAWQALNHLGWKLGRGDARGGDRVVRGKLASSHLDRDETGGDAPADVLCGLRPKIPVKSFFAAGERRAVAALVQRLHPEGRRHAEPKSSRRRLKARRSAGAGSGGLRIASAIWRWSSTERRMISVSSMVRQAASRAAVTTKSVRVRPSISAARLSSA